MDRRTQILDAAERRARKGGFNGFSFREVADDVGIKSASVHYHFPTKEELAAALTQRYMEQTLAALPEQGALSAGEAFDVVAELFTSSNEAENLMCLCGIFGAETGAIPDSVRAQVGLYFEELTNWLAGAIGGAGSHTRAQLAIGALEGGLIMSRVSQDPAILRGIVASLRPSVIA